MGWVRSDGGRWGERTVKNGRIQWLGQSYEPDDLGASHTVKEASILPLGERARVHVKYDDRLEGQRLLFFTYGHASQFSSFIASHVFLWGKRDEWPGPNCVDGVFRWEAWKPALADLSKGVDGA